MSAGNARKTVSIGCLTRIEGEGAVRVTLRGDQVEDVQLRVFEPPRLFEAFLRGRHYSEVPDFVARICGICPVAHQLTAIQAIEGILGIEPDPAVVLLRRLIYCGEWIESHALHIYMLHAPDFLGCLDVIALSRDHKALVEQGLRLKKAGNQLVAILGGREIHPVSLKVGGFHHVPPVASLRSFSDELRWARDAAIETARLVAGFEFPEFDLDYEFVALSHPQEYAILAGSVVSSKGEPVETKNFQEQFTEQQVKHSNALHSHIRGRGSYLVGPLARFSLNFAQLPEAAREAARECKLAPPLKNPFRSIVVRAVETVFACEEALALIARYEPLETASVGGAARAGCGQSVTEAPRGALFHQYKIDERGLVLEAEIVPPTAQNQKRMEDDLWQVATRFARLPTEALKEQCVRAVRNYDPCISCATHCVVIDRVE